MHGFRTGLYQHSSLYRGIVKVTWSQLNVWFLFWYAINIYIGIKNSSFTYKGPGGSMSWVVGLPVNSYKPITNTAWVRARLCKLQKGCTRLTAASDKVYQLLLSMVGGYLKNKSWKSECVGSFNMDWRILVFYPEPEARDTIY